MMYGNQLLISPYRLILGSNQVELHVAENNIFSARGSQSAALSVLDCDSFDFFLCAVLECKGVKTAVRHVKVCGWWKATHA